MTSGPWRYVARGAFLIGLLANITALWILYKTAKRRNKKHLFMLRCLATNDLMAQIGMIVLTNLPPEIVQSSLYCSGFVVIRAFGLGSGCVAFVMALERWLALTRPFLYHQLVTPVRLKRFLACLWLTAVTITYCPLFGFGLYYNAEKQKCVRFRYAENLKDLIYAYLFFAFGLTLILCIIFCNTSVICELSRIRSQQRVLVRRVSRSIISNRRVCSRYQTPEEVAFAKLMAFVCIIYVACWAPQVVSVPVVQILRIAIHSKAPSFQEIKPTNFENMADMLLCLYFLLDPFVYVFQNYFEGRLNCCGKKKGLLPSNSTVISNTTPTSVLMQPPLFPQPKAV